MSLEDEIAVLKQTVRQWEEEEAFYGAPCRPKELAAMRSIKERLEGMAALEPPEDLDDIEREYGLSPETVVDAVVAERVEGMAAPGDAPMRRMALAVIEYCAGTLARDWSVTKLADILSDNLPRIRDAERAAAEDGARRATAIKAAHVVRAQQDAEHPATYGEIAKAIMALATEATPLTPWQFIEPASSRWRHKKRGTTYRVLGVAHVQAAAPILEWDTVVVYQSEQDGSIWARPSDEFEDGRFEREATPGEGGTDG